MFQRIIIISIMLFVIGITHASAQIFTPRLPIYIVNGTRMTEQQVKAIDPEDILDNQLLPADEQTIQKYGQDASNGVVLITLRYDTPARFLIDGVEQNYSSHVANMVEWKYPNPTARVIISFRINTDGSTSISKILEATDKRLLRRIEKAMASAPKWTPAMKDNSPISTQHVLRITLPQGGQLQREKVIVYR